MVQEARSLDFGGRDVYVGLDVAKQSWKASIIVSPDFLHKTFTQPPKPEVLAAYLRRNFPGATYHCAYEAGFSGFWTAEALKIHGIDCIVVNPADVATTNKERQCKTDRVDAQKLARELSNGALRAIYVPDRQAQEDRSLVRLRIAFVRKQTRVKNQIRALLEYYGLHPKEDAGSPERHWSGAYIRWLQEVSLCYPSGRAALDVLLAELGSLRESLAHITQQIRSLASQERYQDRVELLCTVPGVSLVTAMSLLTELVDIDRFNRLDSFASFVGLVPGERSTGDRQVVTGITRRHNKILRTMIVESAWVAIRHDPALMKAFMNLAGRMPKQCAIVRIAHKLLNRIRMVLKTRTPYQPGTM